jgi:hypothetical protein
MLIKIPHNDEKSARYTAYPYILGLIVKTTD